MTDQIVEGLLLDIDRATEPKRMSKETALDVLERIIDELRMRCEALRDEIDEP